MKKVGMGGLLSAALLGLSLTACKGGGQTAGDNVDTTTVALTPIQFSADSAMASVRTQCDFGPRVPNSKAHELCGRYIADMFRSYGLQVEEQKAVLTGWDKQQLNATNIIASYRPEASERVVLAAHWDSRPWADADPDSANHRKPVLAANDGASGVAVLLEVARLVDSLAPAVGVDFICFDMEDYGAPYWGTPDVQGRDWCLGSWHWAQQARARGYRARYGILLDMVGGQDARFCYEGYSKQYAEPIMMRLWGTAAQVGADRLFVQTDGSWATDDHVPMNQLAGIPTVDVIPYIAGSERSFGATWHTVNDTPEHISPETLRLVGQTLLQMLSEEE